jgi:hypothetical protein
VRDKWQQNQKVSNYPSFLWVQPDDEIDGRVAGRKAVNTSQLPAGKVIFARWSDALIGTWQAVELLVDPYARAHLAEVLISLTVWVAVAFRYSTAFVTSSDSAVL